jgi:murein DD-endopeptidase MepM/ murein hydrolase activator NlpD
MPPAANVTPMPAKLIQPLTWDRRRFLKVAAVLAPLPLPDMGRLQTVALPWRTAVNGGFAVVNLGTNDSAPLVHFNGERVLVSGGNRSEWFAVVGIPLDCKPGRSPPLVVQYAPRRLREIYLRIKEKEYDAEYLVIKSDLVDLTPVDLARCELERTHTQGLLRNYADFSPASLLLMSPCNGIRTSSFGQLRFFNGQQRGAHSGMDIAAPIDTPIFAAGAGEVVDVGDYFFSGRTVIVNHGRSFHTLYAHLNHVRVRPGQRIFAGQRLGTIGITGRVTGPHLHFAVYLNAAAVDPALFLP